MSIFDLFDQDTVSGRTLAEVYPRQEKTSEVKISGVSLKSSRESQTKLPLFLDLRGGGGQIAGASWEMGGLLLGSYTTDSFGESPSSTTVESWSRRVHPNAVEESRLSQILEERAHPRYYLSPRACTGILTRARRRGKPLPERLERALIAQSHSKSELGARGVVRESSSKKIESELCKPIAPNTSCLNPWDIQSKHVQSEDGIAESLYAGERRYSGGEAYVMQGINGDVAETLDASYYKGCGERSGVEREVVVFSDVAATRTAQDGRGGTHNDVIRPRKELRPREFGGVQKASYGIDRAAFNQGQNAQFDFCVDKELAPSMVARGPGAVLQGLKDEQ